MKKFLCSLPIILISLFLFTGCALTTAYKNIFRQQVRRLLNPALVLKEALNRKKQVNRHLSTNRWQLLTIWMTSTQEYYTTTRGVLTQAYCSTVNRMVKELGPIPMQNMWVNGRMELFMVRASLRRMLEENISGNGKMVTLGTETYTTKMGK